MTYLLDVNALVALGVIQHQFHGRVASWVAQAKQPLLLATCPITELGFVRVLAQAAAYGFTVPQARALLTRLKQVNASQFTFLVDDHDVSHLPAWVNAASQTTDGHLVQLANANGAVLATLDKNIPGASLIPT